MRTTLCLLAAVGALLVSAAPAGAIVGGSPAPETPWVVALTDAGGNLFCGGALVAPNRVVTAAHCMTERLAVTAHERAADAVRVVVGRRDRATDSGQVVQVSRVWRHPDFRDVTTGDDVAVLTLAESVTTRPVALVDAGDTASYAPGVEATVLGWGRTAEGSGPSTTLRQVHVPVQDDATCTKAVPTYRNSAMVCAGHPQGGQDACEGDSGGPMVVRGRLVGVVSYGRGCARPGEPGVYTRLTSYRGQL